MYGKIITVRKGVNMICEWKYLWGSSGIHKKLVSANQLYKSYIFMVSIEFIYDHSNYEINIQDTQFLLDEYEKAWQIMGQITRNYKVGVENQLNIPNS